MDAHDAATAKIVSIVLIALGVIIARTVLTATVVETV
jgi:hypothetical protein